MNNAVDFKRNRQITDLIRILTENSFPDREIDRRIHSILPIDANTVIYEDPTYNQYTGSTECAYATLLMVYPGSKIIDISNDHAKWTVLINFTGSGGVNHVFEGIGTSIGRAIIIAILTFEKSKILFKKES